MDRSISGLLLASAALAGRGSTAEATEVEAAEVVSYNESQTLLRRRPIEEACESSQELLVQDAAEVAVDGKAYTVYRNTMERGSTAAAAADVPVIAAATVATDAAVTLMAQSGPSLAASKSQSSQSRKAAAVVDSPARQLSPPPPSIPLLSDVRSSLMTRSACLQADASAVLVPSGIADRTSAVTAEGGLAKSPLLVAPGCLYESGYELRDGDDCTAYIQWRHSRMQQNAALGSTWRDAVHLYAIALRNYRCVLLSFNYGYSYGIQMALYNVLAVYLKNRYDMSFIAAGALAGMPSLLNSVVRPASHLLSGLASRRWGMRGRLVLLWSSQSLGGLCCVLLSFCGSGETGLVVTTVVLILFAVFTQIVSFTHVLAKVLMRF